MNRPTKPATVASLAASVLLLAGCGAASAPGVGGAGPANPGVTRGAGIATASAAGTAAPTTAAAATAPGAAGTATAPGLLRHRHAFDAAATRKPHNRRPHHSAPLRYSRR